MTIETYGTERRVAVAAELARGLFQKNLIFFPVPTTKDKIHPTGSDVPLSETLVGLTSESVVVGYSLPSDYKSAVEERGAKLLDLALDEKFLTDNADITADGALGYILTSAVKSPRDTAFGIVGYGRIGSRMARMLLFLGARVRVYTSKETTRLELCKCGVECCEVKEGEEYSFDGIDILINTAPKDMTASFKDGARPHGMRVIELASGDNFKNMSWVEKLPALPERMLFESGGRAYFEAVKRFMGGERL